jgi:hypothetical protein
MRLMSRKSGDFRYDLLAMQIGSGANHRPIAFVRLSFAILQFSAISRRRLRIMN